MVPTQPVAIACVATLVSLGLVGCSSGRALHGSATSTTLAPRSPTSNYPPPPTTKGPLRGRVIHIDAGHNGGNFSHLAEINQPVNIITKTITCDTTGTEGSDGYTESEFNLDVALRLQKILELRGARVVMTRIDDRGWGPCINERAAIGNRARADAAISIHADGNLSRGARGFHIIEPLDVPGHNDAIIAPSAALARDVRAAFPSTGMPVSNYIGTDGIIARDNLGGLNFSQVPKVFIECGNMRNATDLMLLEDSGWRQMAARALADAITRFLS